jgi:CelD/BcsL family acetyltransferase involved in cellulose biosynthesis
MSETELSCRIHEGHTALAELRDQWQVLAEQCPWATPFQQPQWLLAWTHHHRSQRPWTVVVYERERLIGLAPLFLYMRGRVRVLAFLGAGVTDYGDVLTLPGRERAVLRAMFSALASRRAHWDVCELDEVRPSISPLTRVALPHGWSVQISTQSTCPSLSLPASVDELAHHVPLRHLRKFQKYFRHAARSGDLRLERATPTTCGQLLDTFFALHSASWHVRGEAGVMAEPSVRALHHEAAAAFAERDALGLYVLRLDERPIASVYGFECGQTFYSYLGGFAPAAAQLSPGTLVLGLVFETLVARGLTRFDFLRGAEAYKYWWGAEDRHTVRLCLTVEHAQAHASSEPTSAASK